MVRSQSTVGNAEVRIVLGVLGHFRERRGLQAEVHLHRDRAPQGVDHFDQPQPPRLGGQFFGAARHVNESAQIAMKAMLDAGPQHFDGDGLWPVHGRDFGAMHLRDRGGGDRRTERRKNRADRLAERLGDRRFRLRLRERRHLVLQPLQIVGERGADHVRAGRQKLTELDIARTEPGQRGGQPLLGGAARRPLDQADDADERARRRRHHRRIDHAEDALAGKNEAGAAEADETRERGNHKRQPECKATMPPVMS